MAEETWPKQEKKGSSKYTLSNGEVVTGKANAEEAQAALDAAAAAEAAQPQGAQNVMATKTAAATPSDEGVPDGMVWVRNLTTGMAFLINRKRYPDQWNRIRRATGPMGAEYEVLDGEPEHVQVEPTKPDMANQASVKRFIDSGDLTLDDVQRTK